MATRSQIPFGNERTRGQEDLETGGNYVITRYENEERFWALHLPTGCHNKEGRSECNKAGIRSLPKFIWIHVCIAKDLKEKTYAYSAGRMHGNCDTAAIWMAIHGMASLLTVKRKSLRFHKPDHLARC